jgi:HAD superfamily hydrolase (TIGR01490 family)
MKTLSVFDLDRTLIRSNCSLDFCRYLVSKKVLPFTTLLHSFFYYLRHLFLRMTPAELHNQVFERFLKGRPLETLERHAELFVGEYLERALYIPALCQLRLAQHLGHHTLILSNSPSFLVRKIAERLGVSNWQATEYAVDKEQRLCHIATIMQGEEKASCVLKMATNLGIASSEITAYSDSIWDLPLLLTAGTAVVVHPDRKLRTLSQVRNWQNL